MKQYFNILLFLLICSTTWGQKIHQKQNSESVNSFFTRVKPSTVEKSITLDKIVLTPFQNNGDTAYVVSYLEEVKTYSDSTYLRYFSYLFYPIDSNKYQQIFITKIEKPEKYWSSPVIDSIFFANADKDPAKEIVIFYYFKHPQGTHYNTLVFDNPDKNNLADKLPELYEMREILFGGCDCTYNGKTTTAKFKKSKDIKKELIRLGFK